jgi:hypothetical protein
MNYQIQLRPVTNVALRQVIMTWYLDAPQQLQLTDSATGNIKIRGWVLAVDGMHSVKLLLRIGKIVSAHSLDQARPDVIKKILGVTGEGHPRLRCGFEVDVVLGGEDLHIGFEINGTEQWARRVSVEKAMKVLEGTDGHLFLSNDTNRSVDQYTGEFLISAAQLERWDGYLDSMAVMRNEFQTKTVFLVAPAKEYIFPENFPFSPGENCPMAQLASKFGSRGEELVYPVTDLKSCREISYPKGDSHWTDFGGLVGAEAALKALGVQYDFYANLPKFSVRKAIGDLTGTLSPPRRHPTYFAEFKAAGMIPVFENGIDNHGRIWVFERSDACGETAVVFGDSFSKSMVPWLSLVFKRLVYVHSATSIDPAILQLERPQAVFLQTNGRFVVSAPSSDLDTRSIIAKKVAALDDVGREVLASRVEAQRDEPYKKWMQEVLRSAILISLGK